MKDNMTDKEFLEMYSAAAYKKALEFIVQAQELIESARIVLDAYKTCSDKAAKMTDD